MNSPRQNVIARLAEQLRAAEDSQVPIDALTDQINDLTLDEAYRIQAINLDRVLAEGGRLVGRKIGLTSKAMQEQLGVDEPDVGAITDRMVIPPEGDLDTTRYIAPRVEAELAFRLRKDLDGPITMDEVRASIGSVMLAAEIIDSRIRDWNIKLVDTVADNASSAGVLFGREAPATDRLLDALPSIRVYLEANGAVASFGDGSAVLGHPLNSVLWLARTLEANGAVLRAGDLVLAGAVHASVPLTAGVEYAVRSEWFPALTFRSV